MGNTNKRLLSRAVYKRIKGMDREQISDYVTRVYVQGFDDGRKAGTPDMLMRTIREELLNIPGIGPTRADAILKKLGDTFSMRQSDPALKEGDGAPEEATGNDVEVQMDG